MRFLLPAVLALAVCVVAQQPPPIPQTPEPQGPEQQQQQQQPEPEPAEYAGPAILSRGGMPSVRQRGEFARIRPYLSLNALYDGGLAAISTDFRGQIPEVDGVGVQANFGAVGTHAWRRTLLSLDYRGDLRHYNRQTYYDGTDHTLTLGLVHRLSRRMTLQLNQSAASLQRSFDLSFAGPALYNPTFGSMTTEDLFDNRTHALLSSARLIYQLNTRWSMSMGGTGTLIRRRSRSLAGADGYGAMGDVAYRISRHQTMGFDYSFAGYQFTGLFGSSQIHGLGVNWALRLGRRWELNARLGGYRAEVSRLTQVQLDPAIAALLGQNVGIETFHRILYLPMYQVHLTRSFRRQHLAFGYDRIIVPGNGVYLTSSRDAYNGSYSYSGFRRLSLQTGIQYYTHSSLSFTTGKYRGISGGGGFTYRLSRSLSMIARYDARRYDVQFAQRIASRAMLGIAWSPGDYPLAIW